MICKSAKSSSVGESEMTGATSCRKRTLFCLAVLLLAPVAWSQNVNFDRGFAPSETYDSSNLESVNLSNGNLLLRIPIISYAQRGTLPPFTLYLRYNNPRWNIGFDTAINTNQTIYYAYWEHDSSSVEIVRDNTYTEATYNYTDPVSGLVTASATHAIDASGAHHVLETTGDPNTSSTMESIDGTGLAFATIAGGLIDASGISHSGVSYDPTDMSNYNRTMTNGFGETTKDPMGNVITPQISRTPPLNFGSSNVTGWIDSVGRHIPAPHPPAFSTASYCETVNFPGVNGGTTPIQFCYTLYILQSPFNVPWAGFSNPSNSTWLTSINFQNGTRWGFDYDIYGELQTITTPTGGTISYTWANTASCNSVLTNPAMPKQNGWATNLDPMPSCDRMVTSRTFDAKDGTPPATWKYSIGTPQIVTGITSTTVTNPNEDDTVHMFTPGYNNSPYETTTLYYSGPQANNNLLKRVDQDFQNLNYDLSQCSAFDGTADGQQHGPAILPTTTTTTWPNGQVSQSAVTYDSGHFFNVTDNANKNYSCPLTYGRVVQQVDYDYGQGAPGQFLRQINKQYQWQNSANGGNYLTANLIDRVASVTVLAGTAQFAQTTYGYDENNGSPQGVFGNQTSVTRWLYGGTSPKSQVVYNSQGMPSQTIDAKGNVTKISYDSTGMFQSQVQLPTTSNGVQHIVYTSYDLNTGLKTSLTDQNGTGPGDPAHTTSYTYDNMGRVKSVTGPPDPNNGGQSSQTVYTYDDVPAVPYQNQLRQLPEVEVQQNIDGRLTDSFTLFDGLGRAARTATKNDEDPNNPYDQVDTCYDGVGHKNFASYPYRSTGFNATKACSNSQQPGDTFSYDAVGRLTTTTHTDGNMATIDYSKFPTTTTTDEAGNARRTRSDALGRLLEVDEPGAGPETTATGSVAISGMEGVIAAFPGSGNITISGQPRWKTVSSSANTQTGGTTSIKISGAEQQWPVGKTSGTGTVSFSGNEQLTPGQAATGSVTINGSLKSKQVQTQAATNATATISITGSEQLVAVPTTCYDNPDGIDVQCTENDWDEGYLSITINGREDDYGYGRNDTSASLAAGLAGVINGDSAAPATAAVSGSTLYLTSKATGPGADYSVTTHPASNLCGSGFYGQCVGFSPSYDFSPTAFDFGSSLSGGQNPVYGTLYDQGSCSATFSSGSTRETFSSPWSGSSTAGSSIVQDLANRINGKVSGVNASTLVSAGISSNVLNLTAKNPGSVGNNIAISSSCTYDSNDFPSNPSFSTTNSGSNLNGGQDIYDKGSFTLTLNPNTPQATNYTVSWQKGDTSNTIAGNLKTAINNNTSGPITATVSGAVVTVAAVATGGISNYPVSISGAYDSKDFKNSSFGATLSGSALAGGAPPVLAADQGTLTVTVNGNPYQATWGATDSPNTIAQALANALGKDPTVQPQLSSDGATVYITPKALGPATYTSSTTFAWDTAKTGHFPQSSFTPANAMSDWGQVTATVNNHGNGAWYAGLDTPATIAQALVSSINAPGSGAYVTASASGAVVTLTATNGGANTDYNFSSAVASSDVPDFSPPAFSASNSGAALAGGADPVYDAGNVSVSIANSSTGTNFQATSQYQQGSTIASILTDLNNQLNSGSSPVKSSIAGSSLNLTARNSGTSGDLPIATGSSTSKSNLFSAASFSASGTGLSGGTDSMPSLSTPAVTLYSYDMLDNLVGVQQQGNSTDPSQWRQRSFVYDTLSRLLTATNPESGTIGYTYDANGNLSSKTLPAPNALSTSTATQTISYCYDELNRVTGRAYGPPGCPLSSPVVSYAYDAGSNGNGYVTSVTDHAGSASYSYDVMGQMATEQRTIAGVSQSFSYAYNLDSSLKSITYPSGRVVSYGYNVAQRLLSATDNNNIGYASGAHYTPFGALSSVSSGPTTTSNTYDARMQPYELKTTVGNQALLDLTYDFHYGQNDNGNIYQVTNNKNTARTQQFGYDALNRLVSALTPNTNSQSSNWNQNYSYDNWGNLLQKNVAGGDTSLNIAVNGKNQVTNWCYDAAGNITGPNPCATYANNAFPNIYDAENQLRQATVSGVTTAYDYDANGQRVKKVTSGIGTLYWYGPGGEVLEETDLSGTLKNEYIFFGGKRVARYNPATDYFYYFSDHLGSANVLTDASGGIKEESDYYPFGGERVVTDTGIGNNYKFTGKERDPETGLDYFGARYYGNAIGRFLSPDPSGLLAQHPENPQSWNLYSYVLNNPVINIDPNGLDCVYTDSSTESSSVDHNSSADECGSTDGTWLPGYVDENWVHYNSDTQMWQVASVDGAGDDGIVSYSTFAEGAITRDDGFCVTGCQGADFSQKETKWLNNQLVGNSILGGTDELLTFMTHRDTPIHGMLNKGIIGRILEQIISGPLAFWTDHWAGPSGMGAPGGQGDWAAMVHDFNYETNGIKISSYLNPSLSPDTAKALIQSNNNLIRNAGGYQSVKMGMFFGGLVNGFQLAAHVR
ncbi:MAG TPA: RHS repeat-associated core domain-containing protein [Terriglobales bacterium]|jgi:RHS repeat-associated protein|nr:RHS repeat-associated core domain-containing protein [Terriglobales bacterium]